MFESERENIEKIEIVNDDNVLTQKIKTLYQSNRLEKALELCNSDVGKRSIRVQSQEVKILIKMFQKDPNCQFLEEAIKICEANQGNGLFDNQKNRIKLILSQYHNKSFELEGAPTSSYISYVMINQNLEDALAMCNDSRVSSNLNIQNQKVKILMKLFQQTANYEFIKEAQEICKSNAGVENFDKMMQKINEFFDQDSETYEKNFLKMKKL